MYQRMMLVIAAVIVLGLCFRFFGQHSPSSDTNAPPSIQTNT